MLFNLTIIVDYLNNIQKQIQCFAIFQGILAIQHKSIMARNHLKDILSRFRKKIVPILSRSSKKKMRKKVGLLRRKFDIEFGENA